MQVDPTAHILIIDDDKLISEMIADRIMGMGHKPSCAHTCADGLSHAKYGHYDLVFLDVSLPDGSGLDLLPAIQATASQPEVIIITGLGDPDGAELAIKNGAWDYCEKPLTLDAITLSINRALQYRREKISGQVPVVLKRDEIIGNSPAIKRCLEKVARAARSDAGLLITGATGTGKELFARAVHENSNRANANFVVVDCAGLPETLVESVLYGYAKGAFTGADHPREGLVKQADGGTLFLDEIGELPFVAQGAFLRALQEHRYRPVGSKREIESDFRVIAATNRDLDKMVADGSFRIDLLFRLRSIGLALPPLKNRKTDISAIATHYLETFCTRYGTVRKGMSTDFIEALTSHEWPGNVRELINVMESVVSKSGAEPILFPVHLPTRLRIDLARSALNQPASEGGGAPLPAEFGETFPKLCTHLDAIEEQYLRDLITHTGGHVKTACSIAGISKSRLYARLKKYGISRKF